MKELRRLAIVSFWPWYLIASLIGAYLARGARARGGGGGGPVFFFFFWPPPLLSR